MVSYLTFEGKKGSPLKSLTPRFFLLENFQQPLSLIQIYVSLQPAQGVEGIESSGIGTKEGPLPQTLLKEEKQDHPAPTSISSFSSWPESFKL